MTVAAFAIGQFCSKIVIVIHAALLSMLALAFALGGRDVAARMRSSVGVAGKWPPRCGRVSA